MPLSDKARRDLKKAEKRRLRKPTPTHVPATPMAISNGQRRRFTNQHAELLLSLETTLVRAAAEDEHIDDAVIASTLKCFVQTTQPPNGISQNFADDLTAWMDDLDEEDWQMAMRIVYESVNTRSNLHPGKKDYLEYAAGFVRQAQRAR